jgi:hypothetical protein
MMGSMNITPVIGPPKDGFSRAGWIVDTDVNLRWNDMIDKNGKYWTDSVKSCVAEIITFGTADGYRLSISWDSKGSTTLNGAGKPRAEKGYPWESQ